MLIAHRIIAIQRITLLSVLAVVVVSCQGPMEISDLDLANRNDQGFFVLPFEQLPYQTSNLEASLTYSEPLDADSVELFDYMGGTYYHTVSLCNKSYVYIGTYLSTRDERAIFRARKYVDKLLDRCIDDRGALWSPMDFDFAVHGDSSLLLRAPWYSGMAQGELLSVCNRLFVITEDSVYLRAARKLFRSLTLTRDGDRNWVTWIDPDGYYWIEEYPHPSRPGHTLNGFIAALFGVYDYILVSNDPLACEVWEASLTTLKHYFNEFRQPGGRSLYCLGHRHMASVGYHRFHIEQLRTLFRMTNDSLFVEAADVLEKDFGVTN